MRLMSGAFPLRTGEAWGEGTPVPAPRVSGLGGDAPSGVSMHSSDDEMSQSKTVGLGSGRQAGGWSLPASTIGLWAAAEAAATSSGFAPATARPKHRSRTRPGQGLRGRDEVK